MLLAAAVLFLHIPALPQLSAANHVAAPFGPALIGAASPQPTEKPPALAPARFPEPAELGSLFGNEEQPPAPPAAHQPGQTAVYAANFPAEMPAPTPTALRVPPPSPAPFRVEGERKPNRRLWLGLAIAQHGAAAFDTWSTRRVIASGQGKELNPFLRPFAGSGALYAAMQVTPGVLDLIGSRMMTSRRPWLRRLWWLPQTASTAVSLGSGVHNLGVRH